MAVTGEGDRERVKRIYNRMCRMRWACRFAGRPYIREINHVLHFSRCLVSPPSFLAASCTDAFRPRALRAASPACDAQPHPVQRLFSPLFSFHPTESPPMWSSGLKFYGAPKDIPSEEREAASLIASNLADLEIFISNFQGAVRLFDFCEMHLSRLPNDAPPNVRQDLTAWQFIACRDGAMSIFHLACTLEACLDLRGARTWRERLDAPNLRIARRLFGARFPHYRNIRHAVAHAGEMFSTTESIKRHAIQGRHEFSGMRVIALGGARIIVRNSLMFRQYSTTFLGKLLSYEMSGRSLDHLIDITARVYEAFGCGRRESPPEQVA